MPREVVMVQVGQCGNQIGRRFWELALREHAACNKKAVYDEALSSFFRNVDTTCEPLRELPVGNGRGPIQSLKARCLMIDMEEGVVNEMLKGPLSEIFDHKQLLTDVSGSGNNWAHGHNFYGPKYHEFVTEKVRATVEECDSLQSFFLVHSLGGGTGSGLGSYIMEVLQNDYPQVYRYALSVFPSEDDDVITSPYNALMSSRTLMNCADCVLPVENQALMNICATIESRSKKENSKYSSTIAGRSNKKGGLGSKPFDAMNAIAANLVLNLTSSVRFEGQLNVDMNEITMNLVPFPGMHFLTSSMSPLIGYKDMGKLMGSTSSIDQVFRAIFSRDSQLVRCDPQSSVYLACGVFLRGPISVTDINRNIARIRPRLTMPAWNTEGFKLGLCKHPPVGVPFSALCLSNNTCIKQTFMDMHQRFRKLYKKKFYLHHYTEYLEATEFDDASNSMLNLISKYQHLDDQATNQQSMGNSRISFKSVGHSLL